MSRVHSFRPIDTLTAEARYTTVATVKSRLRIPTANTDFDARILSAIITAEVGIDQELGHAFPQLGIQQGRGKWRSDAHTTPPPSSEGEFHKNAGSTEVYLSKVDAAGNDLADQIEASEPFDEIDDVLYLYFTQPGDRWVRSLVSAVVDNGWYWTFTVSTDSGSWVSPAFLDDTLTDIVLLNSVWPAEIPAGITAAATSIAHAIYKAGDAPTGSAGSDDFIGSLDVAELVRREFQRNPGLVGFRTGFGVA